MRVVVFTTWPDSRLAAWSDAIRRTAGVTDVLIVRVPPPGPADPKHPADVGTLLVQARAWHPDCGVAIGVRGLSPVFYTIPARGTLSVRIGHGPDSPDHPPGFWELWSGAERIVAEVDWLGLDRAGHGAVASAPVYRHDTPRSLAARAEELGRLLLSDALRGLASHKPLRGRKTRPAEPGSAPTPPQRAGMWLRVAWNQASRVVHPRTLVKLAGTAVWLTLVRPVRDVLRTIRGRHPVRIYTLHRVTNLCRDGMTISPSGFRRQLAYIRRHHDVVGLDTAMRLLAAGTRLRRPVAAITFDDGYSSVAQDAHPIMEAMGVVGACFVCPRVVDMRGRFAHDGDNPVRPWMTVMDWPALSRLREAGWHIGSHTMTHARLSTLSNDQVIEELRDSRIALRERLGADRMVVAYPFGGEGDITPEGIEIARWCGYAALVSDYGGENVPGKADRFVLRRIDIGGDHDPLMWRAMVHGLDLRRMKAIVERRPAPRQHGLTGANGRSVAAAPHEVGVD